MSYRKKLLVATADAVHRRFLLIIIGSYLVAGLAPQCGIWLKNCSFGTLSLGGQALRVSLSLVLLSLLLLNAGLGVDVRHLRAIRRSAILLASGIAANVLMPVVFICALQLSLRLWHNPDEVQNILTGLAIVASMPIAGSSTAWSQNANGDMALSLGLVLGSTILSPFTTPVALHVGGFLTMGDYSEDLHELAAFGTGMVLILSLILPCVLGVCIRSLAGEQRIQACKPILKLVNAAVLGMLIYANASVSLPHAIAKHDYDFLAIILVIVTALCCLAFATGWLLSKSLGAEKAESVSLMFGLGMNNNGTGLVLGAMAMANHPDILLPIITYNLIQHLVAGIVDRLVSRESVFASVALQSAPS